MAWGPTRNPWDPERIGAELYPFRSPAWRRARIAQWLADLGPDHARLLDCGRHVVIANLAKYQSPPKPSYQFQRAHDTCLRQQGPAGANGHQVAPARGFEGEGKEGGFVARASARDEETKETAFSRGMAAAGYRYHPEERTP